MTAQQPLPYRTPTTPVSWEYAALPLPIVAILGAVDDSRFGLPRAPCATALHMTRGPQGRPFAIDVNVMCDFGGDSFAECILLILTCE